MQGSRASDARGVRQAAGARSLRGLLQRSCARQPGMGFSGVCCVCACVCPIGIVPSISLSPPPSFILAPHFGMFSLLPFRNSATMWRGGGGGAHTHTTCLEQAHVYPNTHLLMHTHVHTNTHSSLLPFLSPSSVLPPSQPPCGNPISPSLQAKINDILRSRGWAIN